MKFLFRLVLTAFAFILVSKFVPGIAVASVYTAFVLAIFWGIMNVLIKPILLIITLPINILTFGLFTLVINGFLFWFLSTFIKGFVVESFLAAIVGTVIIAVVSWFGDEILHKQEKNIPNR